MFTVYAISSIGKTYIYVGMTSNLEDRLNRHNSGYEKTTRPYHPFRLIYQKDFLTRALAREYEKFIKTTRGKRTIL
ncbi:GIY-YIG nuclease family protein [Algoriphagus aquimarinus]|uniref:GIY-YIG nuclease family protein n=1 Tax=Algoriphagus aquimarinus TaxID=237018 RepID=UPI000B814BA9|nr:GIY-YIG nuclease family protein [Algoriphagus aquimarinus]